jgi:hypothetical protein
MRRTAPKGEKEPIEFKLRVLATAIKISRTWNVKLLGGHFNTNIAIPIVYQQLACNRQESSRSMPFPMWMWFRLGSTTAKGWPIGFTKPTSSCPERHTRRTMF